jgi:regulatory protein
VQQVLAACVEQGLLSDERFAEALVRSRRRRGYGPVRIRRELQEKGLPEEAVARWVDARSGDWLAEIERVRRRKFGPAAPRDLKERARQARFLQSRGFTYEQIRTALNSDAVD